MTNLHKPPFSTNKFILAFASFSFILFLFSTNSILAQTKGKTHIKNSIKFDSLNTSYQKPQFCEAYSSNNNMIPSNGESHSKNIAKTIDSNFNVKGFQLIIDNNKIVYQNYGDSNLCHYLYAINYSDTLMQFAAQDIYVNIIPEAIDTDNIWKPIGYIGGSSCGNSYHKVTLGINEYWSFKTYIFKGKYKTKLRYVFYVNGLNDKKYYSNEITSFINLSQFDREDYLRDRIIKRALNPFD